MFERFAETVAVVCAIAATRASSRIVKSRFFVVFTGKLRARLAYRAQSRVTLYRVIVT